MILDIIKCRRFCNAYCEKSNFSSSNMWSGFSYRSVNNPDRIITIARTIIKNMSFCFLEKEKVFRPYSVTRLIGITEKITKNGIKKNKNRFSGITEIRTDINNIELIIKIQLALMYCDF